PDHGLDFEVILNDPGRVVKRITVETVAEDGGSEGEPVVFTIEDKLPPPPPDDYTIVGNWGLAGSPTNPEPTTEMTRRSHSSNPASTTRHAMATQCCEPDHCPEEPGNVPGSAPIATRSVGRRLRSRAMYASTATSAVTTTTS